MTALPNPFSRVWMDTVIQERPTREALRQQYIGLNYFPMRRVWEYQNIYDIMLSGNRQAGVYAHDGTPIPGQGYNFKTMMYDVMHIMASRTINPNTVLQLKQAGELSVHNSLTRGHRARLLGEIAEKIGQCQDRVESTIEYLCLQALQGSITWPPKDADGNAVTSPPAAWGNVSFTLDMGFRSVFKQAATTLTGYNSRPGGHVAWSTAATSTPRKDLEVIGEYIQETTGLSPVGMTLLMSRTLLSRLAENAELLSWFKHSSGGYVPQYLDIEQLKNALQTRLGYNIQLYDAIWTYQSDIGNTSDSPTENQVRFLDRKYVICIPRGALGPDNASFAVAPDIGAPNGENMGVYTWSTQIEKPPWTQEIGCGIHGFPVIKDSQAIFRFDALN